MTGRITFTPGQTQALVSLLCTIGSYRSIDVYQRPREIIVVAYRNGESTIWALGLGGTTRELTEVPA